MRTKRRNAEPVGQDFPHFVGIAVRLAAPAAGLHVRHGIQPKRGQGLQDANGRYIR